MNSKIKELEQEINKTLNENYQIDFIPTNCGKSFAFRIFTCITNHNEECYKQIEYFRKNMNSIKIVDSDGRIIETLENRIRDSPIVKGVKDNCIAAYIIPANLNSHNFKNLIENALILLKENYKNYFNKNF